MTRPVPGTLFAYKSNSDQVYLVISAKEFFPDLDINSWYVHVLFEGRLITFVMDENHEHYEFIAP